MLRHTFCHLPGIGAGTERKLWLAGFHTWEALLDPAAPPRRCPVRRSPEDHLRESQRQHQSGNAAYFAAALPSSESWRLFRDYRDSCAYLDIETTGMGGPGDYITTIAIYDGSEVRHFVHGQNLDDFPAAVARYRLLVTYNGSGFDLPFLRRHFGRDFPQAHIDLRYVLKALGHGGGLKSVERQLGVERKGMEEVDGYVAVLLWREYQRRQEVRALQTLLAYNAQDVLNLEPLMVTAFNRRIAETPFAEALRQPEAVAAANPFDFDGELVRRVLRENPWMLAAGR